MIAAGKDAFLNRYLLSNRVMVWFGLISYPLYIWHWPFLSFAWIVGGEMPQLKVRIGCVVLAVVMSAVTYYLVEPRLRWGRFGGYKAAGLLSVMVIIGVTGYSIDRHNGYTARMDDPEQPVIDAIIQRLNGDNQRCLKEFPDWSKLVENKSILQCKLQQSPGKNTIALIGDSHAGMLYQGLAAKSKGDEGVAVFPAGCAIPLIGLHAGANAPQWAGTEKALSEGFQYILSHNNIKKVILSHFPNCSYNNVIDTKNPKNNNFNSILHDGFERTYDALTKAGKEIYVVIDIPFYSSETYSKCKASAVRRPVSIPDFLSSRNTNACSMRIDDILGRKEKENWTNTARKLAIGYKNIHFIDLDSYFCPNGICSMLDGKGAMLYQDTNHINVLGSIHVSSFILKQMSGR